MLTIAPRLRLIISGSTYRQHRKILPPAVAEVEICGLQALGIPTKVARTNIPTAEVVWIPEHGL